MTDNLTFNIYQQSSGLLKIDPAELLSINKSISTINSANITITTN